MTLYIASDGSEWTVRAVDPPIPTRACDWEWVSQEYGGPGDDRHGNAASKDAAVEAIEEYIMEDRDAE